MIGFDLVGQEDIGQPLHSFVHILQKLPPGAKCFFHAGETSIHTNFFLIFHLKG